MIVLCIYNDIFAHYCRKLPVWRRVCSKHAGYILFIIQNRPTSLLCTKSLSAFLTNTIHVKWFFFPSPKGNGRVPRVFNTDFLPRDRCRPIVHKRRFSLFFGRHTRFFFVTRISHQHLTHLCF